MQNPLLLQIATLITAAVPVSLIAIIYITKFFSKNNPKLADTTVICTTILGTLTKKEILVKHIFFNKHEAIIEEENNLVHLENNETKDEKRIGKKDLKKEEAIKLMAITTTLCHFPKIHEIEAVIAKFFKICAIDSHTIRENYETIAEIPSNSEKKISTIVVINKINKEIFGFTKGNPRKVLEKCKRILIDGKKIELDSQLRRKIKKRIDKLNKNGEKVIAFAYKPLPIKRLSRYSEQFSENDLVFIGLVGLGHYSNMDLIPTIEKIKESNIKTYILSSISERKTIATARELNMINPRYFESITEEDLKDLSVQKLRKMLENKEKDFTFSELKKESRQKIISALIEQGEVIAMANKKPKNSIKEVFENIQEEKQRKKNHKKLVCHALSCRIAEIILIITAIILKAPLPLTIPLILIVDIFINIILELSLQKESIKKFKGKIGNIHIALNGVLAGIIITTIYLWNLTRFGWYPGETIGLNEHAYKNLISINFILLAIMQIFSAFNLKHMKKTIFRSDILKNHHLILTSIIAILLIYILTIFPFFQEKLGLKTIAAIEWQIIIFAAILIIVFEEIRKYLIRKNEIFKDKSNPQKSKE